MAAYGPCGAELEYGEVEYLEMLLSSGGLTSFSSLLNTYWNSFSPQRLHGRVCSVHLFAFVPNRGKDMETEKTLNKNPTFARVTETEYTPTWTHPEAAVDNRDNVSNIYYRLLKSLNRYILCTWSMIIKAANLLNSAGSAEPDSQLYGHMISHRQNSLAHGYMWKVSEETPCRHLQPSDLPQRRGSSSLAWKW